MLTEYANSKLREMHSAARADAGEILRRAKSILHRQGLISDVNDNILSPETRTSFFEVWSPFWFLPQRIGAEQKVALGASMLASWTAIAQIDNSVDEGNELDNSPDKLLVAMSWDKTASDILKLRTKWPDIVAVWSSQHHSITQNDSPETIILKKNPFYPEVFRIYLESHLPQLYHLGKKYTMMVGILDEAADLMDDLSRGRPNYIAKKHGLSSGTGTSPTTLNNILTGGHIEEAISESLSLHAEILKTSEESKLRLFADFLEYFKLSFEGYEEFCLARALIFPRR